MEAQREKILQESLSMFINKGFTATRIEDVAAAVGISRSPFYYYFKNKDVLFQNAISYYLEETLSTLEKLFGQEKNIFIIFRECLCEILLSPDKRVDGGYVPKDIKSGVTNFDSNTLEIFYERATQILNSAICRAIESGQIRDNVDSMQIVRCFLILYEGKFILVARLWTPPPQICF
jgi:AcrR family transcriptional regulator